MKKESQANYTKDLRNATNFPQTYLVKSIADTNKDLEKLSAQDQLRWGYDQFDERFVLTTSFGIQSAVLLHMTVGIKSNQKPKVIWIDTGYLPKETYNYAEELTKLFELNLLVAQSPMSPARMRLYMVVFGKQEYKKILKNIIRFGRLTLLKKLSQT